MALIGILILGVYGLARCQPYSPSSECEPKRYPSAYVLTNVN
jgi:hypothetical protein